MKAKCLYMLKIRCCSNNGTSFSYDIRSYDSFAAAIEDVSAVLRKGSASVFGKILLPDWMELTDEGGNTLFRVERGLFNSAWRNATSDWGW